MPAPPAARQSPFEGRSAHPPPRSSMCPWTLPAAVGWTSMKRHPVRAFAPGRVNLIGEHTDYNDGLCLPFAIELGVTVTAELQDGPEVAAPGLPRDDPYLRGALAELRAAGVDLPGCVLEVDERPPAGRRAVVLGRAVRGAHAGALRRGGGDAARARGARPPVLPDRERARRCPDRPARPARVAARRGGPGAAARPPHARVERRSSSSSAGTCSPCSTQARRGSSPAPATTSAARSAGERRSCSASSRCATRATAPGCRTRSAAACAM